MRKAAIALLSVVLLFAAVSCESDLMKSLMLNEQVELKVVKDEYQDYMAYVEDKPLARGNVYECIELYVGDEFKDKDITLVEGALGPYKGLAEKVVIPKQIKMLEYKCISDTTVKVIEIDSEEADMDCSFFAFEGCTSLQEVRFKSSTISGAEDLDYYFGVNGAPD